MSTSHLDRLAAAVDQGLAIHNDLAKKILDQLLNAATLHPDQLVHEGVTAKVTIPRRRDVEISFYSGRYYRDPAPPDGDDELEPFVTYRQPIARLLQTWCPGYEVAVTTNWEPQERWPIDARVVTFTLRLPTVAQ